MVRRVAAMLVMGAVFAFLASGAQTSVAQRRFAVDLSTGYVDGHRLLGRSIAGVTASFGAPSWRHPRYANAPLYRIGYGDRREPAMEVLFRRRSGMFRAVTVAFRKPPLAESRLGSDMLALTPREFTRAVFEKYKGMFTVATPLKCAFRQCSVTLRLLGTSRYFSLGKLQRKPFGTYLSIWVP